jgi:branched-chain amino acid transport system ATP-binding protein
MTAAGRPTLLKAEGLDKSFGSLHVIESIDLEIAAGEALGIIGPNGAGKSTLFALFAGALRPDGGRVLLDSRDITDLSPQARCRAGIGRTFQIPHPFEKLSVFENLAVAATHGTMTASAGLDECGAILEQTGLLDLANTPGHSLTLLQRKRLELARALATRPRLLLLDEIAGGLSEAECDELIELIGTLRSRGITIVWIEHVVDALLAVAERLVVLNFGKKIAEGEPSAVMEIEEVREVYLGIAA